MRSGLTEPVPPRRRFPTPPVKMRFVRTADFREAALMLLCKRRARDQPRVGDFGVATISASFGHLIRRGAW